ncbi:hypothetical protein H0H93_016607 [Arthromyces matolae]|nr:hypothetical protein H0H93_016607 [Arthromyces matolae]
MLSNIFQRLRRHKSHHKPRVVLVPPNLSQRDSFSSPFPQVSHGGYSLYYELQILERKRAEKELRDLTISKPRPIRYFHKPSHFLSQTPGASSSHTPLHHIKQHSHAPSSRSDPSRKSKKSRRLGLGPGLERISEASFGPTYRSLRKRKKIKDFRQVVQVQAFELDSELGLSMAPEVDTPETGYSNLASSSHDHGTVDTPPTTVEDLPVLNFEEDDDCRSDAGYDFERPESASSYYTARSDVNDE